MSPVAAPGEVYEALNQVLVTGTIDWSEGIVRVIGVAAPVKKTPNGLSASPSEILDAAWRMAQSNLLDTTSAIQINADTRVGDRMAHSVAFREGMVSLAKNASITGQEYLSDGTLKITLVMSLTGGFAQFVLPKEIRQVEPVTTMMTKSPKGGISSRLKEKSRDVRYSGLVIDAAGIDVKPSLVPVVVDESGEVVYGPAFVSREFAVSRGMCSFATSLEKARNDKQAGENPLIVKALRTPSGRTTDLVVSNTDAAQLRSSVVHLNFLKACRVIIVMDQNPHP